jgi:hypothetical protein
MGRRTRLLISNIPPDCDDAYLTNWVEARGYRVFRITSVSGLAYVQLMDESRLDEAARTLNGATIGESTIRVNRLVPMRSLVRPAAWV